MPIPSDTIQMPVSEAGTRACDSAWQTGRIPVGALH
jgi:hypothetical protein